MASTDGNFVDYPNENVKKVLDEVLKSLGFKEYNVQLTRPSLKGENYMGVIFKAAISGTKNENQKVSMNLILKTAPTYERKQISIETFYYREIFSYNTILKKMTELQEKYDVPSNKRFNAIKMYKADTTRLMEILIMDDMNDFNFKISNKKASHDFDHVILVMKHLAYFHSLSFKLKECDADKFREMASNIKQHTENNEFYEKVLSSSLNYVASTLEGEHKEKFQKFLKTSIESFRNCSMPELAQPYSVFCHGDCWTNNILFQYQNNKPYDIRFLDWQMIKQSSPLLDILFFLFASTDYELRSIHFMNFLDYYYETLKCSLARLDCNIDVCFPRSVFEEHLKLYLPYGLIMGCQITLILLLEEDDIPDVDEMLRKGETKVVLKNEIVRENYKNRVRGIVNDVIKYNGI